MLVYVLIVCLKYFMIFKVCNNVYICFFLIFDFKIIIKSKDVDIVFKIF